GAVAVALSESTLHIPSLQTDNFGGAKAMTARLIELGHTRIAFIAGPAKLAVANVRLQGYMAAMVEAGLTIDPHLIIEADFLQSGGEQAAQHIHQMPTSLRPSAVFAANGEMAFGVLLGLGRLGWHVPQGISVCGFDDLPMAQLVAPALTTVQVPVRLLGRAGAQKLFAQLKGEEVSDIETLPTKIIERGSTAPVSQ
ncbi:MAG TPA: LacI family DNA-binding transcriptional regulator, partial [Ktedonobacteraceae bacterium]|nr:LacI family DNA-binding transcriptional regulator [Ktedonobacteraceae bacterium]